jgi:DNA (cytosine-5)-methyltransferase 1
VTLHRPLLLDFYCCGGGASRGYAEAGFTVLGVDNAPQPRYPYPFHLGSAIAALDDLLAGRALTFRLPGGGAGSVTLDAVSAVVGSPPCQAHTDLRHRTGLAYEDWIDRTRDRFTATGLPWIIENVEGAPLRDPLLLCGTSFGLSARCRDGITRQLWRHRLFESNVPLTAPGPCVHRGQPVGVYGHARGTSKRGYKGLVGECREALGIDWLPQSGLAQAIPPAYTRHLGGQLLTAVREDTRDTRRAG